MLLSLLKSFQRSCFLPPLAALCVGVAAFAQQPAPQPPAKPAKPHRPIFEPKSLVDISNVRPVNVAQLEEALRESHGRSDRTIAKQLAGLGLTQRFSLSHLQHWQPLLPGKRSRQALVLLADASAFLPPPDTDEPALPTPALLVQKQILTRAIHYFAKNLHQLPNFFATRITAQFAGADSGTLRKPDAPTWRHLATHRETVLYRAGNEIITAPKRGRRAPRNAEQMEVEGTFGPILVLVIHDASHGTVEWSHWETGPSGPVAVYRYRVSKAESHYAITYQVLTAELRRRVVHRQPIAYHGEFDIDPSTGAILRLTLEGDPDRSVPFTRSDVAIDYGLTPIGGQDYICPVRSVAIARGWTITTAPDGEIEGYGDAISTLNQITFTKYHIFRSTSRILTGNPPSNKP